MGTFLWWYERFELEIWLVVLSQFTYWTGFWVGRKYERSQMKRGMKVT